MDPENDQKPVSQPVVQVPGLGAVPVVVVKLKDGTTALRHPSEVLTGVPPSKAGQ